LGNTREIFLSGEAFFEVTKNPKKPFLVFANGLVTKVLGTSFSVRAYDKDKEVTVEVKSGKVSVFAQSDANSKEKATNRELAGVVLTPNQKIVYAREEVRMAKLLVEAPIIIAPEKVKTVFEFEDTPVSEILRSLEKAYSIDIVFEELLSNCPLTASLTDLQLFDKLNIICKGVEARYEILDGQIVIYSKGCR
jgi:transmembrane sensor